MKPKRKQAASKILLCEICGKEVFARGLKSHIRLKHELNIVTQVISKPVTQVDEKIEVEFIEDSELFSTPEQIALKKYVDPYTSFAACIRMGLVYRKLY